MKYIQQSKEFYDNFSEKFIKDYTEGNKRIEKAIQFVLNRLPTKMQNVLDVGCGIGWSSFEIARNFPKSKVQGIDLSPKLIQFAQNLFKLHNLFFDAQNILEVEFINTINFDAIILIDVFEHIPSQLRLDFIRKIKAILLQEGLVFLTCPTIHHQNWLQKHKPEGLQPVDEWIKLEDIIHLAQEIGGEIIYFEYQSIWKNQDYFHAIIQKKEKHHYTLQDGNPFNHPYFVEPIQKRQRRVKNWQKTTLKSHSKTPIALLSPLPVHQCETFIRAHYEHLEGDIHFLSGKNYPTFSQKSGTLTRKKSLFQKIKEKVGIRLKLQKYQEPHIEAFEQYLKKHQIQLVFCEYGTYATQILNSVRRLNIPLIVHFHGYDAYKKNALENEGAHYLDVFDYARFLIAVSKPMQTQLEKLGAKPSKIIVTPYGVQEQFFSVQPDYQSSHFIAIGRLVDKKAPYLTIMAFHKVYQKYPEAKVQLIGNGYLWDICKNLVQQLQLENQVRLLGNIPHHQIPDFLQRAFCFLQHSVQAEDGDSEGTPVAILEASAAGLPIVSTFHAGISEAVLHEKTGFLVDEKEVDRMAAYMIQLFEDRNLAQKMGEAGRKHILEHYKMEHQIQRLNEAIRKAIIL